MIYESDVIKLLIAAKTCDAIELTFEHSRYMDIISILRPSDAMFIKAKQMEMNQPIGSHFWFNGMMIKDVEKKAINFPD